MEFGPVPESKYEEVIHHLRNNFPDEPLNVAVGLCKHGEPCEYLEHHDLMTLKDQLSVMAVESKTGAVSKIDFYYSRNIFFMTSFDVFITIII